jgi:hypothetical protein
VINPQEMWTNSVKPFSNFDNDNEYDELFRKKEEQAMAEEKKEDKKRPDYN